MKKTACILLVILLVACLAACGSNPAPASDTDNPPASEPSAPPVTEDPQQSESDAPADTQAEPAADDAATDAEEPAADETAANPEEPASNEAAVTPEDPASNEAADTPEEPAFNEAPSAADAPPQEEQEEEVIMEQNTFYVHAGGETFSAAFADNSGAEALKELLAGGDLTIEMRDYGGFEKVGSLGQSLPAEDSQTTTEAGDIVLYQGNQIVMFYGSNAWSYTRLGKIEDLTGWQEALGSGDITVTLSLQAA